MGIEKIEKIIQNADDLPTLPVVYMKLNSLIHSSNASVNMMSKIISEDPVISSKVLKIVNSAFYGFQKKIGDLQRAIVILGINQIKSLVLLSSMVNLFDKFKSKDFFDMEKFWAHSIACAVASRVIAENASIKEPENVFTGGLLHDIGKLIHALYLHDDFKRVIESVNETSRPMYELENEIFGFDHSQTGRTLAAKWEFPEDVRNMISHHHLSASNSKLTPEIAAVHCGNSFATALEFGSGGEKLVPIIDLKAWDLLGIAPSRMNTMITRMDKMFAESMDVLKN